MADGDGKKVVYDISAVDKTLTKGQNTFPAYVLYRFYSNSLSVTHTNLSTARELQLRKTVARKLDKGCLFLSRGSINPIDFSSQDGSDECHAFYYCCLLKQDTLNDADRSQDDDSQQFIVCFVHTVELHLLIAELDRYSVHLLSYLDSTVETSHMFHETSHMFQNCFKTCGSDELQSRLVCWWTASTRYLVNCIKTLQQNLKYLIYVALLDAQLKVVSSDDQLKADIISFVNCCGLSELLNTAGDRRTESSTGLLDTATVTTHSDTAGLPKMEAQTVTLHIDGTSCRFSSNECNRFCEEWAGALTAGDSDDPVFIRLIIDNYRFKTIQDMNALKRLLQRAQTDYYSLFRSIVFLRQGGNSAVLLRHAALESDGSDPGVIDTLQRHLQAACGTT